VNARINASLNKLLSLRLSEFDYLIFNNWHLDQLLQFRIQLCNTLRQACSTVYVLRTTSAKFGLHAGNVNLNTKN